MRVSIAGEDRARMCRSAHRAWAAGILLLRARAGPPQGLAAPAFAPGFARDHAGDARGAARFFHAAWIWPRIFQLDARTGSPSGSASRLPADGAPRRRCTAI